MKKTLTYLAFLLFAISSQAQNGIPVISGPRFSCGVPDTLTVSATNAVSYAWSGGRTPAGATNILDTSGTYTVTVTYTNAATAAASRSILVNTSPTINAVANVPAICPGTQIAGVSFTGNNVPGTIYSWTNSNLAIGLPGGGIGNIASFTATNPGTGTISATITVTPILPGNDYAYVASGPYRKVLKVDVATNSIVDSFTTVSVQPYGIAVSPDHKTVYVSDIFNARINIINTETHTVFSPQSYPYGNLFEGMVVSPDATKLYLTDPSYNRITILDAHTGSFIDSIHINGHPVALAISTDGSKLYVAQSYVNTVSVVNTSTLAVTNVIPVSQGPVGVVVSPTANNLYTVNQSFNSVSEVSTISNSQTNSIGVGSYPINLAISPDGSRLYTINANSHNISVINTTTNAVISTIPVAGSCNGISVTPDNSRIYVTNRDSNEVMVFDAATYAITARIPVPLIAFCNGNFMGNGISCMGAPVSFTITVNPAPTPVLNGANSGCGQVSQTVIGFGAPGYAWSGGSTPHSSSNTFTSSGIYSVTVTGFNTCTAVLQDTVTVSQIPVAGISGLDTACGAAILTATGGTSYYWNGGTATQSATDTFATGGTYSVTATGPGGCTATASRTVYVKSLPVPVISGNSQNCYQVSLTASGGIAYAWSGGLSPNAAANTFLQSNNYTLTVTGSNNCTASLGQPVSVYQAVSYPYNRNICPGDSFLFHSRYLHQSGTYYDTLQTLHGCDSTVALSLAVQSVSQVQLYDSICTGSSIRFHGATLTAPGVYSDTLPSSSGCDSIVNLHLFYRATPVTVSITASATSFCPYDSVSLCATSGFASYRWNNSQTQVCIHTHSGGTYSVTATAASGCTVASAGLAIRAYPATTVSVTHIGDSLYSASAANYLWYRDGQANSSDTTRVIIATTPGNYYVQIRDSNGCTYSSGYVNIPAGIEDIGDDYSARLYPNPGDGSFRLTLSDNKVRTVQLNDLSGRAIVPTQQIEGLREFDYSFLTAGVYLLSIRDQKNTKTLSLVVVK